MASLPPRRTNTNFKFYKTGEIVENLGDTIYIGVFRADDPDRKDNEDAYIMALEGVTLLVVRCAGVTPKKLQLPVLEESSDASIVAAIQKMRSLSASGEIHGFTGDGPGWLKHQDAISEIVEEPCYMDVIVLLPMILACFKNFESVLVISETEKLFADAIMACSTFEVIQGAYEIEGDEGEWVRVKAAEADKITRALEEDRVPRTTVVVDGESREMFVFLDIGEARYVEGTEGGWLRPRRFRRAPIIDTSRLVCMPAEDLCPVTWKKLTLSENLTERQQLEFQTRMAKKIRSVIEKKNAASVKHGFIKAILVGGPILSGFTPAIREAVGLPVFDMVSLLNFFAKAQKRSGWNEGISKDTSKKLGVLTIDYDYPEAVGDIRHPDSYGFVTEMVRVPHLTFEAAQAGNMEPLVLTSLAKSIRELERRGVTGITGDCGFMMHYQCFARYVANIPVFMSALIQAATVAAALQPNQRVLIVTANSESLSPQIDLLTRDAGITVSSNTQFLVEGLQDLDGFQAVAEGTAVPWSKVAAGLLPRIRKILKQAETDEKPIASILLECTELPQFADILRKETDLPVFDAITCVNFFAEATPVEMWTSNTFTPHNLEYWIKNYTEDGARKKSTGWFQSLRDQGWCL